MLLASIVTKMEVDGKLDSKLSFNKKPEVSLIYDLQDFAYYFKKESTYSNRLAIMMQLKPDTIGLGGGNFLNNLYILGRQWKIVSTSNVFVENIAL